MLLLPSHSPFAFNLSQHLGLFQWICSLHQVAKVLELQLQHQSFNEYPGFISCRIDWFYSLPVQGTLKTFFSTTTLKHHFFRAQPSLWSNSHIRTWLLERSQLWLDGPYVGKVMSPLFKMLSSFVIAFLSRSKHLLISWLQSPSTVTFGVQENKICHCFHCFPIYLPWSDGTGCHDLSFLDVEF